MSARIASIFLACISMPVVLAQTPSIRERDGALNGASFASGQPVALGSLVSIFGTDFTSQMSLADSIPLSTSLGGVSVTFNNVAAPMVGVFPQGANNPAQINAQVPWNALPDGVDSGSVNVVVTRNGVSSPPRSIQVARAGPGIFSTQFGVGQAIAINLNGSLAAATGAIPGLATEPAKIGSTFLILATGVGPVDSAIANGAASIDKLRRTATLPVVLIGGVSARVDFAGLTPEFPGVYQLNVVVPDGVTPGNAVPLQLRTGGITTTDQVTMAVIR
jgi:uncharacterized protein (TIGR03437 family)